MLVNVCNNVTLLSLIKVTICLENVRPKLKKIICVLRLLTLQRTFLRSLIA